MADFNGLKKVLVGIFVFLFIPRMEERPINQQFSSPKATVNALNHKEDEHQTKVCMKENANVLSFYKINTYFFRYKMLHNWAEKTTPQWFMSAP